MALPLLDLADLQPGERVLDLATGTGMLARLAARRVAPGGAVTGLDLNDEMLKAARELPLPPGLKIEWRQGSAQALPFDDGAFDVVVCQFGAMFFPDKTPMTPVNLSRFKEIVFWARGDGGQHQLMVFASRLGDIPVGYTFAPGKEWKEFVVPFSQFSGIDGSDIKGILFSAGAKPGPFRFAFDEVRFR